MTPPKATLRHDDISSFIDSFYDCDLHAKRVLSLTNATQRVLTSTSLAVHAVGQGLAQAQSKLSKHGVKQVDRLLSNDGIVLEEFFSHWVPYTFGARSEVVALDWTSFARDGHDTLVLSVLTHHGRATPLMWKSVRSATLKGNRTRYEHELLEWQYRYTPEGVKVTVVADRGFASAPLMRGSLRTVS